MSPSPNRTDTFRRIRLSILVLQPFRLTHLRRALTHILAHRETLWVTVPGSIARHYRALPPDQQLTGA